MCWKWKRDNGTSTVAGTNKAGWVCGDEFIGQHHYLLSHWQILNIYCAPITLATIRDKITWDNPVPPALAPGYGGEVHTVPTILSVIVGAVGAHNNLKHSSQPTDREWVDMWFDCRTGTTVDVLQMIMKQMHKWSCKQELQLYVNFSLFLLYGNYLCFHFLQCMYRLHKAERVPIMLRYVPAHQVPLNPST